MLTDLEIDTHSIVSMTRMGPQGKFRNLLRQINDDLYNLEVINNLSFKE